MALIALFCYNRGRGNVTWPQQGCHNRAVTKATRIRGCASAPAPSRHTRLPMWPPSALQTGRWGHHAGSPGRPFTPPSGAGPSHRARMDLPHNKPDALQTRCTTNRANNKPGGQKKGTPDRQNRCALTVAAKAASPPPQQGDQCLTPIYVPFGDEDITPFTSEFLARGPRANPRGRIGANPERPRMGPKDGVRKHGPLLHRPPSGPVHPPCVRSAPRGSASPGPAPGTGWTGC